MRSFVMNVATEVKRLQAFTSGYPDCLPPFEVVDCLTEDTCPPVQSWWKDGAKSWAHLHSYLKMLRLGEASGEDFLCFEDDAIFAPDFEEVYTKAVSELPLGWDMLYLGGCHLDYEIFPPRKWPDADLLRGPVHWNTACLVNKKSVRRVIEALEETHWPCPHVTDYKTFQLHTRQDFMTFSPLKYIVGQSEGVSTVCGRWIPEKWGNDFVYITPDGEKVTVDLNPEGAI